MITFKLTLNGALKYDNGVFLSGHTLESEEYKQWLLEGGIPEPEFTAEEVAEQARLEKVFEAKSYLASTDYKVLPDYDGDTTGIVEARAEARNTIRTKEVL